MPLIPRRFAPESSQFSKFALASILSQSIVVSLPLEHAATSTADTKSEARIPHSTVSFSAGSTAPYRLMAFCRLVSLRQVFGSFGIRQLNSSDVALEGPKLNGVSATPKTNRISPYRKFELAHLFPILRPIAHRFELLDNH